MANPTAPSTQGPSAGDDPEDVADGLTEVAAFTMMPPLEKPTDVLHVLEETLTVSKVRRATGGVRVGTRTETVEVNAEVDLDRYRVEVTHVPVGRVVDEPPVARAEGDTTIIPVVEERLVLVKQLFLVEELHVRHVLQRETVTETVTLRRQHAVVERLDDRGEPGSSRASADTPLTEPR